MERKYRKIFPEVKRLKIEESKRKGKRLKATFVLNGEKKTVHFGDSHSLTYYDKKDEKLRKTVAGSLLARVNKEGKCRYQIAGTATSFSYYLLWGGSKEI